MSEGGDYETVHYDPTHDFSASRREYAVHSGRSYEKAVDQGVSVDDLLPKSMTSHSTNPLIICYDESASMIGWPGTFYSKFPYLVHEATMEYLGQDTEISFAAHGDAPNRERYPVQARPFAKRDEVKTRLKELVHEGDGGGTKHESSELVALYYLRNVKTPDAVRKPIYIFITDEMSYERVSPDMAAVAKVKLDETLATSEIFRELNERFAVYLILKPYYNSEDGQDSDSRRIREFWLQYIDADHIAPLADPNRVVDVVFGILAKETDRVDYFNKEITERQTPEQVAIVKAALGDIHARRPRAKRSPKNDADAETEEGAATGQSTLFKPIVGPRSKKLA